MSIVNPLVVMDDSASLLEADAFRGAAAELREARAAVAELVGALTRCASECAECGGTGRVERNDTRNGVEYDTEGDCPDCEFIRAALAKAGA